MDDRLFEELSEKEQDRLLFKVARLVRPMLGEIGEVLVTPRPTDGRKPGFVGLLFQHQAKNVILIAEYIEQSVRTENRLNETEISHILAKDNDQYIEALIRAGAKREIQGVNTLEIPNVKPYVKNAFEAFYKDDVNDGEFRIKLHGMALHKLEGEAAQSILYFACKEGEEFNFEPKTTVQLAKLVEQLIRNALGLSGISDQELRSAVAYLSARLPESFDDYVVPQTLAAIYAYVREVVPMALNESNRPDIECDDGDLKEQLKCIHTASHIRVNRAVGGSRKGASVYSLDITTRAKDGESTTSYPAIAKFSSISEARDEADGLRKMQRYFSSIGKMLPPPLAVYLLNDQNGKPQIVKNNWWATQCISVTPDLEGKVLSEKITEHWASPTGRVQRFSEYLLQAKAFIRDLQRQPFDENTSSHNDETPALRLITFIKEPEKDQARYKLLSDSLSVPSSLYLKINESETKEWKLVNPAYWLSQMLENPSSVRWKKHPTRLQKKVLAHGDFHSGNLFYSAVGERLTVLDYDRVRGDHSEEDLARLDASFVAFVFSLKDFGREENWTRYALPAIALVAGSHTSCIEILEKNAFARDLMESLTVIRPPTDCPFYAASVIKALLIELKTSNTKREGKGYVLAKEEILKKNQGQNAATWLYLALMLGQLVEIENEAPALWEPYGSALLTH